MARRPRVVLAYPSSPAAADRPPTGPPAGPLATVAEVAAFLRVHKAFVYAHVDDNTIPYYRVGRALRFDLAAVAAALTPPPEA